MKRVALHYRVSTDDQTTDLVGVFLHDSEMCALLRYDSS